VANRWLFGADADGGLMSWRIATRHTSTYRYSAPVVASYNEARITPAASGGQRVIESAIAVKPASPLYTYVDYFSTVVVAFDIAEPHEELVVVGTSVVETAAADPADGCSWDDLKDPEVLDRYAELLVATPVTSGDEELFSIARRLGATATPKKAVDAVVGWFAGTMRYERGATEVSTSALEAWRERRGVCQDFAHVALVLLRAIGIPSRYVSGYLHPDANALLGTSVEGASHAWVECWIGSWYAVDPTNGAAAGERHVTVARGRDYADVAPFRGVYHGGALASLDVSVELTRLE
jgi:transglutaminase-like putative cysteine protease